MDEDQMTPGTIAQAVMPAQAGIQYAVTLRFNRNACIYWVTRFRG
jgi:hypothetical protein